MEKEKSSSKSKRKGKEEFWGIRGENQQKGK
ncbi:hypothetical protein NPIL_343081, partial [Nephila pilipes]